jgi:PRD1 phage membrane DNA delivery
MKDAIALATAVVTGIIGLAIVSVIVSRRSQTPQVIGAAGAFLSNVVAAAVSPAATAATNGDPLKATFANPLGGIGQ